MKADVENLRESERIASHRKEHALRRQVSIIDPSDGREIVVARTYWPGSVCYACIWVCGRGIRGFGAGKAGGYGYCKESASIAYAIADAGIKLSEHVDGHGITASDDALESIARAVTGKRKFFRVVAHG